MTLEKIGLIHGKYWLVFFYRKKPSQYCIVQTSSINFIFFLYSIAKAFDIDSHVLSPEETKKLYPLMNVSDIYGTLYSPGDGTINPDGLCQALTRSAKRAGAKVIALFISYFLKY